MDKFELTPDQISTIDTLGLSEEERSFLFSSNTSDEFIKRLEDFITREEDKAIADFKRIQEGFRNLLIKLNITEDELMLKLIENEEYEKCHTLIRSKEILGECDGDIDNYFRKKKWKKIRMSRSGIRISE